MSVENTTMKYVNLISKDEKQVNNEEIQNAVETARIETDHAYLSASKVLSDRKRSLNAAISSRSFNPQNVIIAQRKVKEAQQDVDDLMALKSMF